jgi:hypothetical protein
MKNVYFACSIAGGRDYAFVYKDLVEAIKKCGSEVKGELFADPNLEADLGTDPGSSPRFIWERDTDWLQDADAVIAEATQPSLGVGYQIARAEALRKPVLVLFYKKSVERFSWMISGSPEIQTFGYNEYAEAKKTIKDFITKLG